MVGQRQRPGPDAAVFVEHLCNSCQQLYRKESLGAVCQRPVERYGARSQLHLKDQFIEAISHVKLLHTRCITSLVIHAPHISLKHLHNKFLFI